MGYDIVVLDPAGRERIAFDELRPDEWRAAWDASRLRSLPMLMSIPDFWGDERTFALEEIQELIRELDQLDADSPIAPELARASQKLRRMARVAFEKKQPLLVLPD